MTLFLRKKTTLAYTGVNDARSSAPTIKTSLISISTVEKKTSFFIYYARHCDVWEWRSPFPNVTINLTILWRKIFRFLFVYLSIEYTSIYISINWSIRATARLYSSVIDMKTAINWCVKKKPRLQKRRKANHIDLFTHTYIHTYRDICIVLPQCIAFNLNQDYVTLIRHIHIRVGMLFDSRESRTCFQFDFDWFLLT